MKAVTKLHVSSSSSVEKEVRIEGFEGGTSLFGIHGSFI